MLWAVPLLPVLCAPALWAAGRGGASRRSLGAAGAAVLALTTALAGWAAATRPRAAYRWGAALDLELTVAGASAAMAVLVPAVALGVVAYAAAHEDRSGLARLVAGLVGFVGAMELLVLAGDVITLLVGWEAVGALSWALIAHRWHEAEAPAAAGQAFVATHVGDLGLFAAAGAAVAGAGTVSFAGLDRLGGGWLDVFTAGVVVAALAKSAQVPFSPWLFSAMAGPTSVSALLHSATMVAAGAYALVRLHPILDAAAWFGPVVIAVGLATALVGGLVASVQRHAKKVLAASTSAQYGLMLVAVGAGYPGAAMAHLVAHAALKAGLFMSAGVAMEGAGSPDLGRMGLGRELRTTAVLSAVVAAALAAVPPLGAALTKEAVVSAAGHESALLAVAVVAAGGLSAWYAARFQLLAFGPGPRRPGRVARRPLPVEVGAIGAAAAASVAFGLAWLPGGREVVAAAVGSPLPAGEPWELLASMAAVAVAVAAAVAAARWGRLLGGDDRRSPATRSRAAVAGWVGIAAAAERAVVRPTLALAAASARFDHAILDAPARAVAGAGRAVAPALARADDRVVDAGVRGAAALGRWAARVGATVTERGVDAGPRDLARALGRGGRETRRLHTGLAHQYYVLVAAGLLVMAAVAAVGG